MTEHQLCALADIADGDHRVFMVGTLEFGVFRNGEQVVAWESRCPHAGGPVCQGRIYKRVTEKIGEDHKSQGMFFTDTRQIVCPWHGYEFEVATGRHPSDHNVRLKPVDVAVREGQIYARLPA
jgi:nitrite reductase (NADH) small subunit